MKKLDCFIKYTSFLRITGAAAPKSKGANDQTHYNGTSHTGLRYAGQLTYRLTISVGMRVVWMTHMPTISAGMRDRGCVSDSLF